MDRMHLLDAGTSLHLSRRLAVNHDFMLSMRDCEVMMVRKVVDSIGECNCKVWV